MSNVPWLSLLVFFPLAAGALIALAPRGAERSARLWATVAAGIEFVLSLPLWWRVIPNLPGFHDETLLRVVADLIGEANS